MKISLFRFSEKFQHVLLGQCGVIRSEMLSKKLLVKTIVVARWSTLVPIVSYLLFISIILNVTFPLKKQVVPLPVFRHGNDTSESVQDHKAILSETSDAVRNALRSAFSTADVNTDHFLDIQELAHYIHKRITSHIERSIEMNPIQFANIDKKPRDGLISWEEYHSYFLREHGMNDNYILQHNESKHVNLNRKAKEEIMRDKALWSEAARTDPFSLTLDEFLAFRHPESSAVNLLSLVDDLLRQFDMDGDDQLSIEEFSDVTADDEDERYKKSIISKTVEERRIEFLRLIDKNKDGKADRGELLNYVDPRNPRYALQEAATLITLGDANKDGKLSFEEIMFNSKIFMSSKMIDTATSFHEEF